MLVNATSRALDGSPVTMRTRCGCDFLSAVHTSAWPEKLHYQFKSHTHTHMQQWHTNTDGRTQTVTEGETRIPAVSSGANRRRGGNAGQQSAYLWAPPPPRRPQPLLLPLLHRRRHLRLRFPRRRWPVARLPRTAGSPPPGCLRGAAPPWTSGSWLSPWDARASLDVKGGLRAGLAKIQNALLKASVAGDLSGSSQSGSSGVSG